MKKDKAVVNPAMLKWARRVAGYSLDQVAKVSLLTHMGGWEDAREILVRAEKQKEILCVSEVRKLAKMYKMPSIAMFYLAAPPFPWWWGWMKRKFNV